MLSHRCEVNNAGSSEIFGKKGLALKPQHLVVVEAIFLFLGSFRHSLYFFVVTGLVQH